MNNAVSPGFPVIYSSTWSGESPISSGNTQIISKAFELGYSDGCSMQIFSDGGAEVDFNFQITNLPRNFGQYGYKIFGSGTRDDSFDSAQWDVTPAGAGTLPAGSPNVTTLFADSTIFRAGRLLFQYSSGGSANIIVSLATTSGV